MTILSMMKPSLPPPDSNEKQSTRLTCKVQVAWYCRSMPNKSAPQRRSGCPLNASVEMVGDRWSLLIVRDMMLRGFRTYNEFLTSHEGIATNILADRLRKLEASGIVIARQDPA